MATRSVGGTPQIVPRTSGTPLATAHLIDDDHIYRMGVNATINTEMTRDTERNSRDTAHSHNGSIRAGKNRMLSTIFVVSVVIVSALVATIIVVISKDKVSSVQNKSDGNVESNNTTTGTTETPCTTGASWHCCACGFGNVSC